jgi:putative peptidoglycan lipid II flippase
VYSAVSLFSLGLIVHSLLEIVARSFYADEDTLTPLWAALAGVAVNFGAAITLTGLGLNFFRADAPPLDPQQVGYLSLANSLGTGFQLLVLLWILRGRWNGINEGNLWRVTWKTSVASAAMGAAVLAVDALWRAVLPGGFVLTLARVGVEVLLGAAVFTGAALLLRLDEVRLMLDAVRARLTRRTREQAA